MSEQVRSDRDWERFILAPFHGAEGEGEDSPTDSDNNESADEGEDKKPGGDSAKSYSQAEVDAFIKESRGYRQRAQKAEDELKKINDANLSELDKAKKELTDSTSERDQLKAELARERFASAVLTEAYAARFADPSDAISLLNPEEVTKDDDGRPNPASLKAAIKRLVESKPYLVGATSAGGGDGGSRGRAPNDDDKTAAYQKEYQDRGMVPLPS